MPTSLEAFWMAVLHILLAMPQNYDLEIIPNENKAQVHEDMVMKQQLRKKEEETGSKQTDCPLARAILKTIDLRKIHGGSLKVVINGIQENKTQEEISRKSKIYVRRSSNLILDCLEYLPSPERNAVKPEFHRILILPVFTQSVSTAVTANLNFRTGGVVNLGEGGSTYHNYHSGNLQRNISNGQIPQGTSIDRHSGNPEETFTRSHDQEERLLALLHKQQGPLVSLEEWARISSYWGTTFLSPNGHEMEEAVITKNHREAMKNRLLAIQLKEWTEFESNGTLQILQGINERQLRKVKQALRAIFAYDPVRCGPPDSLLCWLCDLCRTPDICPCGHRTPGLLHCLTSCPLTLNIRAEQVHQMEGGDTVTSEEREQICEKLNSEDWIRREMKGRSYGDSPMERNKVLTFLWDGVPLEQLQQRLDSWREQEATEYPTWKLNLKKALALAGGARVDLGETGECPKEMQTVRTREQDLEEALNTCNEDMVALWWQEESKQEDVLTLKQYTLSGKIQGLWIVETNPQEWGASPLQKVPIALIRPPEPKEALLVSWLGSSLLSQARIALVRKMLHQMYNHKDMEENKWFQARGGRLANFLNSKLAELYFQGPAAEPHLLGRSTRVCLLMGLPIPREPNKPLYSLETKSDRLNLALSSAAIIHEWCKLTAEECDVEKDDSTANKSSSSKMDCSTHDPAKTNASSNMDCSLLEPTGLLPSSEKTNSSNMDCSTFDPPNPAKTNASSSMDCSPPELTDLLPSSEKTNSSNMDCSTFDPPQISAGHDNRSRDSEPPIKAYDTSRKREDTVCIKSLTGKRRRAMNQDLSCIKSSTGKRQPATNQDPSFSSNACEPPSKKLKLSNKDKMKQNPRKRTQLTSYRTLSDRKRYKHTKTSKAKDNTVLLTHKDTSDASI
jgi:hypothetical protein